MATVNKNFRVKNGLTVDGNVTITGTSGTINSSNILTEATVAYPSIPNVFGTISANGTSVVADSTTDTLTLTPSTGITIVGNATSDTITITNSDLGSAQNIFKTFIANGTSIVANNNSDTITITPSTGITIAGNATSDTITITNSDPGSGQNIFKTVSANGISIVADSNSDTLTITPSTGITITGDAGTDTLTITNSGVTQVAGTSNEIEVSAGTGSVTIGLPDNVTIGNNLTVTGNLTVNGTTTTLNTDTLAVEDNIIMLNTNVTGTPTVDAGLEVERGTYTNAKIYWNETANAWYLSTPADSAGAATEAVIATGGSTNLFNTISDGSNTATPDSANDTLTFTGSGAITATVNATSDTVTIGTNANAQLEVGSVVLPYGVVGSGTVTSAGTTVTIDSYDIDVYRTAKYLIQAYKAGDVEITEIILTIDSGYNAYITEYGNMFSNASLAEFSATVTTGESSSVALTATTTAGTVFKIIKTYIEL
jgi:hypothetical protein